MEFNYQEDQFNDNTKYNYSENKDIFSINDNEISFKYKFKPNKANNPIFIDNNKKNSLLGMNTINNLNFTNKNLKMKGKNRNTYTNIFQNSFKEQNLFYNSNNFNNNLIEENYNILSNQNKNKRDKQYFINNNNNYYYINKNLKNKYSNDDYGSLDQNLNFHNRIRHNSIQELNYINYINDGYIPNQKKIKNKNNQFQNNINRKEIFNPKNFEFVNNININNDIQYNKKINLKYVNEFPNQRNDYSQYIENKIQVKRKKRVIEGKEDTKNEDESLSKIADDLFNYCLIQKKEKNIPSKNNNNNNKNIILNKQNIKEIPDFLSHINQHNFIQNKFKNRKNNIIQKHEAIDELKENLLKNDEEKNDSYIEKIKHLKNINISWQKSINKKIINKEESKIILNNSKCLEEREIINNDNLKDEQNFGLKMVNKSEGIKNEKKIKKPLFDLNKNIYFSFLKNGEMSACQVRKGPNGDLEYFEAKSEECDINLNISFLKKQCIRPFNKDEIKVNEHYQLCENMEEKEIVPSLYDEVNEDMDLIYIENFLNNNFDNTYNFDQNDYSSNQFNDIDFDDNELDNPLDLSFNADISTQCSTNPSIVYSDSNDQFEFNNLNVTFNDELRDLL